MGTYFSHGRKRNYVYSCTIKTFDISKVKKTLVKFVCHVKEFRICSAIILSIRLQTVRFPVRIYAKIINTYT